MSQLPLLAFVVAAVPNGVLLMALFVAIVLLPQPPFGFMTRMWRMRVPFLRPPCRVSN